MRCQTIFKVLGILLIALLCTQTNAGTPGVAFSGFTTAVIAYAITLALLLFGLISLMVGLSKMTG